MKKITGILLKIFAALIALIIIAAILIPIVFKGKIREQVEKTISDNLLAEVRFQDFHVGLFRHFPHLSFSLDELSVVGVDNFEGDTLAAMNSFALVFDLSSLFSDNGYEIRSIEVKKPVINAIILKDGSVNWDIMKPDTTESVSESDSGESSFLLKLRQVRATEARISYVDYEGDMAAYLEQTNITLSGDMTMSETDLLIDIDIAALTFVMENLKYLNAVEVQGSLKLLANLDTWVFTISDNNIRLNDLNFSLAGTVEMPEDDIKTDLTFETGEASFKSLLSLVPSVYMEGYEALDATGFLKMKGSVVGVYSDATMPDVAAEFSVDKGRIKYPDLPGSIDNVIAGGSFFFDGTNLDGTTLDLKRFHFEMAGNSFDMSLALKTPVSDPDFMFSAKGKVDFGALTKAVPMVGMTLTGILDAAVNFEGRYSQIEKEQYELLKAAGKMELTGFSVVMEEMPAVKINSAVLNFSPQFSSLDRMEMIVGQNSDISFSGAMENYIGFFLRDDVLKGSFSMNSKKIDLGEIMAAMPSDSLAVENDTVALTLVRIPSNINFRFGASIDKFLWDEIKADQIKGTLLVNEGVLTISDAGMSMLGGRVGMDAVYDTRDSLKPMVKAMLKASNIDIKSSFETFNTVQKLAPAAKGLEGDVSVEFSYESLLGNDFMPVIKTINGKGKLNTSSVQVVESQVFDKMKSTLKLSDKYTSTFEDVEVSFTIKDGRIYVKPFNTRLGKIKFNIGGDQGLDKTINYIVKTEIPRSELGEEVNNLISAMSAQAALLGVKYTPSDILKINVGITGTTDKPVVLPVFTDGGSGGMVSGVREQAKEAVTEKVEAVVDDAKLKARAEAEEQAAKLVKEAEERGQQLRDEAAKAAEKLRNEADLRATKLVKDAEPKGAIAKAAAEKAADGIRKEADRKAVALEKEADDKANKMVEEARKKGEELVNKIGS